MNLSLLIFIAVVFLLAGFVKGVIGLGLRRYRWDCSQWRCRPRMHSPS